VFGDAVFDPVLGTGWIVGVLCVVRSDWHDFCGQQVVVPVDRIVGAVTDYPDRRGDGERITCDAQYRLLWRMLTLGELSCNRVFCLVEMIVQP